ncbi:DNA polymerase III subunit chi [Inhella gelatinilytica]|uniref:DNA polymerase III subunit chi n=1 Tax=Inhella gelatinilytica TaxID=2795030 RepID=A0A931NEZ7_9BURK|nr:DNA polymerase III subunit chi [Inhella gelatinilytica]MBH9553745.1 DNA polymerase III subunit chi [Inhella gelatinilytica]
MADALEVRFYTGCADPVDVALRLARKCQQRGWRTLVVGPQSALKSLSARLWALDGFWAHAGPGEASLQRRSPLVLDVEPGPAEGFTALIHLGAEVVLAPTGVRQVFEVVGEDSEAREAGRARFRHYRTQGLTPEHHEVAA